MSQSAMPALGMAPVLALLKPAQQAGSVVPPPPVLHEASQYLSDFADIFDSMLAQEVIGSADLPAAQTGPEVEIDAQVAQDAGSKSLPAQPPEEMVSHLPRIVELETVAGPSQAIGSAEQGFVDDDPDSTVSAGQQAIESHIFSVKTKVESVKSDSFSQFPLAPKNALETAATVFQERSSVSSPEQDVTVQEPSQNVTVAESGGSSSVHGSPQAVYSGSSDTEQPVRNGFDAGQQIHGAFLARSREMTDDKPARRIEGKMSLLQPKSMDTQLPFSPHPQWESVRDTSPGGAATIPRTISTIQTQPTPESEVLPGIESNSVQRPASVTASGTLSFGQNVPRSQERSTAADESVQARERPQPEVSTVPQVLLGIDDKIEVQSAPILVKDTPVRASRWTAAQFVRSADPGMQNVQDQLQVDAGPLRNSFENQSISIQDVVPIRRVERRFALEPNLPSPSGIGSSSLSPSNPSFTMAHDAGRSDPMVADMFEVMSLQVSTSSSVPLAGEVIQARSDPQRPVFQQFMDASVRALERPVDLHLSPEELGRVRISMLMNDGVITMTVVAERSETLDLLRRHSEQLAQELRQIGFGTINFSFGQNDGGRSAQQEAPQFGQSPELAASPPITQPRDRPIGHQSGLDIRV